MKKILCSLAVLSFLAFSALNADAQHLYLGARVGTNLGNQSYNSLPSGFSNAINSGLLVGAEVDIPFGKTWYLSIQALYDQKGTNQNLDHAVFTTEDSPEPIIGSGTSTINFNYFEVPVLIKAMCGSSAIRPYFFAGPSFGIFLNGSQSTIVTSTSNGANETITKYESISTSSVRSPDISAVGGAGIAFIFSSNTMFFADVSYAYGVTNVADIQSIDNTVIKSRDIRLGAGILFPLD
ncbi:MAG: porin family protein [Candidatus Kapaibacterium sp.]